MPAEEKPRSAKFQLDTLPDWVKVLVFCLCAGGAAGGGSRWLGPDYTKDFEKLDSRLQRIELGASADHDEIIRLRIEVERLKEKSAR